MKPFRALTAAEQLAEHLRSEIAGGAWGGVLPGVLSGQGARRRCRIMPHEGRAGRALRVGILLYESDDRALPLVIDLRHALEVAGHAAFVGEKALVELKRDPRRVAALVRQNPADAWVVMSGSREVLEWFAASGLPCFAIFGRRRQVAIAGAGPDKIGAMRELVERLYGLGHRRIVLYAREERRKPSPGAVEQAFIDALKARGVATGTLQPAGLGRDAGRFPEKPRQPFQSDAAHRPNPRPAVRVPCGAATSGEKRHPRARSGFPSMPRFRPGVRVDEAGGRPYPLGSAAVGEAGGKLGG